MAQPVLSDLDFSSARRVLNLPTAIAPGQPATFDQIPGLDPYVGGLFAESRYNNTTSTSQSGVGSASTGTLSTPTLATTSQRASHRRTIATSAATAGQLAGIRPSHLLCCRGNAAGFGGFRLRFKFAIDTPCVGNRGFVGLWDSTSAPTNVDPLTSTAGNKIGVAFSVETGNWQLITNLAGVAPTGLDLGASFALNTSDVWMLELKCLENASSINWAITKAGSTAIQSGVLSTNLPSATAFLGPQLYISNNTTAQAVSISQVTWLLTSKNGG